MTRGHFMTRDFLIRSLLGTGTIDRQEFRRAALKHLLANALDEEP